MENYKQLYILLNESITDVFERARAQRHEGTEQDRLDREIVFFTIAEIYENFDKKSRGLIK